MYNLAYKNSIGLSFRVAVALGVFAGFAATAANATPTITPFDPINGPATLPNSATTAPYVLDSPGHTDGTITSPYPVAVGSNIVSFSSTVEPLGASAFEGFSNQNAGGYAFDFPLGTHLIDTFDPTDSTITGPLQINFSNPVGSFVIQAQEAAYAPTDTSDLEQFFVAVYDSSNTLLSSGTPCTTDSSVNGSQPCSYGTAQINNSNNNNNNGKSLYLGAGSSTANISKVIIYDYSDITNGSFQDYTGNSNDVYFGPLTTGSPVPEASSLASFGVCLVLAGVFCRSSLKRKVKPSSQPSV